MTIVTPTVSFWPLLAQNGKALDLDARGFGVWASDSTLRPKAGLGLRV